MNEQQARLDVALKDASVDGDGDRHVHGWLLVSRVG
jgi:hypothetical protein